MLLGLCVIGIVYGRFQTVRRTAGSFDPGSKLVHAFSDPVAKAVGASADGIDDFTYGLLNARRLESQNLRMRDLLKATQLYEVDTEQLAQEIERLRKLQALPQRDRGRIITDIVGFAPYENRITLAVGSADGVAVGMAVECDLGLVGTVQIVDAHRCQAQLLSSAGLTIGALDVDRNPPPEGLLNGETPSKLSLVLPDPAAQITVGDRIVTSGHSEHIPRGILIGAVIAVDFNEESGTKRATVFPAVPVGKIREVSVIK